MQSLFIIVLQQIRNIKILPKNINNAGPSQRTLESCKSQFGFTIEEVEKQLSLAKKSVYFSVIRSVKMQEAEHALMYSFAMYS